MNECEQMIEKHSTDKLFEIRELQIITKLFATAFVQHIHAYYFVFGIPIATPITIVEENNLLPESSRISESTFLETNIP
jgi:hypothetical protein